MTALLNHPPNGVACNLTDLCSAFRKDRIFPHDVKQITFATAQLFKKGDIYIEIPLNIAQQAYLNLL